jgi:hypothetical protein
MIIFDEVHHARYDDPYNGVHWKNYNLLLYFFDFSDNGLLSRFENEYSL